jgi:hypothetical protein
MGGGSTFYLRWSLSAPDMTNKECWYSLNIGVNNRDLSMQECEQPGTVAFNWASKDNR